MNLLAQPVPDGPLVLGLIGAGLADNNNAIVFGTVMFAGASYDNIVYVRAWRVLLCGRSVLSLLVRCIVAIRFRRKGAEIRLSDLGRYFEILPRRN